MKKQQYIATNTCVLVALLCFGCNTQPETPLPAAAEPRQVVAMANTFTASQGNISKAHSESAGDYITSSGEDNWLAFDVDVAQAGRYLIALHATAQSPDATAWIEDYYDNPDGRAYNITSSIRVERDADAEFAIGTKHGSPLNSGTHKMKLHLKGDVKVQKIVFTLIKPHHTSTEILTQNMDGENWEIVWSDEFDGTGLPDTSKWTFDHGDWGWGNNELQFYTENRTKNARLEDGNLIIEAHKDDLGSPWTSARLTTRGKVAFIYGRIEFRAKVPKEKGNWAAGWTLGEDYVDELSWPYCGEIDILESVGYEMDNATGNGKAHASAHCAAYYFKLGNQPTGIIEVENMNEAYHTYAVDWAPGSITASVDGITYFTYAGTSNELSWPFDQAQNIILNLTMGGGWGGLQGMDESVTSQKIIVDYVRVYEKRS